MLGIIDDGDVNEAVRAAKLRDKRLRYVPYWHIFLTDREVERGEEIQEGKTQCPGAQEEWDEEGEAGQEGKGQKTHAEAHPGSDGSIAVSSGTADSRWHDRRSVNRHAGSSATAHHQLCASRLRPVNCASQERGVMAPPPISRF